MTQNQVAYRNMLIAQENAQSNRLQARAAAQQAEAAARQAEVASKRENRSFGETLLEGITSAVSNIGGLLFGIFGKKKED